MWEAAVRVRVITCRTFVRVAVVLAVAICSSRFELAVIAFVIIALFIL